MEDQRISANTNKYSNVYSSAVEISAQMRPLSQGRFQLLLRSVFAHFIEAPTCFRFRFRFCFFFFVFSSRLSRFFIVALLLCFCVVLFYFFFWQITLINYFYQSGKWGQWQLLAVVPISPICLGLVCQLTIRFFSRAHSLVPLPCLCLSSLLFYVILFVCRLMAWTHLRDSAGIVREWGKQIIYANRMHKECKVRREKLLWNC